MSTQFRVPRLSPDLKLAATAVLLVVACGDAGGSLETGVVTQPACANTETTAEIWLPDHLDFDDIAIAAANSATARTFATVSPGWITSVGSGGVDVRHDASVASLASVGQVLLGDRVTVSGFIDTNEPVAYGMNDVIDLQKVDEEAGVTAKGYQLGLGIFYEQQAGLVVDGTQSLSPGYYGPTVVNGTLQIFDGKYRFTSLQLNGTLEVLGGLPAVWINDNAIFNGHITGTNIVSPNLVVVVGGTSVVRFFNGFGGNVISPKGRLELQGTTTYNGFFYGKSVDVFDQAQVQGRAFDPLRFFDVVVEDGAGPSCYDGVQNQGETGPDCGGPCEACVVSFQMNSNNTVLIEGENFHATANNGSSDSWTMSNDSSASGSKVASLGPDDGNTWTTNVAITAPRVDYRVNFYSSGTFNVWIRGKAVNGNADSCHAGLNGSNTIPFFDFPENNTLSWVKQTVTVSAPGIHTINVWGREDGFKLDKIKITKDTATPTGADGAESPQQ